MHVTPSLAERRGSPRSAHAVELLVFLFLVVPSLVLPLWVSDVSSQPFTVVAVATILRDLGLVALVLFFVWRNGEPRATIGWTGRGAAREVIVGLLLFVPVSAAAALLEAALRRLGLSFAAKAPSALVPTSGAQIALAAVLVVVVAVAEETVFRGYVLARLREWSRSTTLAIALSSCMFAVGHAYEGAAGVVTVGFLGVVFALVLLWRRSIVAPVTMHFCQDFIALVVSSLVARGH